MLNSSLYIGTVTHQRFKPIPHKLHYKIYSLLLDIEAVGAHTAHLRLFSFNRFNLFSFYARDYLGGTAEPLHTQVAAMLQEQGMAQPLGTVRLLTIPRVLGFAFNPLSVFYCYDVHGALFAVIYQVNNNWGERHCYILPAPAPVPKIIRQSASKAFYVSPFMRMDMHYDFTITAPAETLIVSIQGSDAQGKLITAYHKATRHRLTDAHLVRLCFTHPFMSYKVLAAIFWEAFLLFKKGLKWQKKPA
jgi:uncharacterized protein